MYRRVRIAAIGAPILILVYGLLRLIDGRDSYRSHDFAWDVGHALFLFAFVLFGALTVDLRQLVRVKTTFARVVSYLAMAVGLVGAACFLWGILGDLFIRLQSAAPAPGPLELAGPLLFQVGMLGLLVMLVATRPHRLPVWSPVTVLVGFLLFAISLDLLPVGAVIVLFGLSPLVRRSRPLDSALGPTM